MTTALVVRPEEALVRQLEDHSQLAILRDQLGNGVRPAEFNHFIEVCKHTGLDPFMRQIYAIPRSGKMTIQTGIDGYRLIAHRTGAHAGTDDAVFEEDPITHEPVKATVTVWKLVGGNKEAFTASARWSEYHPGGNQPMWKKMPFTMLGKCAEALALRKAFPAEMAGVYTEEEMAQAERPTPAQAAPKRAMPWGAELKAALKDSPVTGAMLISYFETDSEGLNDAIDYALASQFASPLALVSAVADWDAAGRPARTAPPAPAEDAQEALFTEVEE